MAVKLVIDHLRGTRVGQRQVLECTADIGFGRHPDNAVVFDARGDIDASSQHALLTVVEDSYILCDVGSSNGTFVAGEKIQDHTLLLETAVEVDFGHGGPRVRLWIGEDPSKAPPVPQQQPRWRRLWPWA